MSCTIKKAAARSILLAIIPNDITRLFTLPPGVPVYGVAAMRKAFDVTFTDPEFQAIIEKTRAVLSAKGSYLAGAGYAGRGENRF
jgi:tripartite-type tricarboxylate transporter receptor subunit TctC